MTQKRDPNILENIRYENLGHMTVEELGDYNFGTIPIVLSELETLIIPSLLLMRYRRFQLRYFSCY